ncbi:MAG: FAD-binding protein [Eubacteriales bacterium]|nr:FAD-binding protein [Eubacteriales bacterium]
MNHTIEINHQTIPVYTYDTIIAGSGAAGFSAAERLFLLNHKNIALVTEHINSGTSRNTGSDKQTYYKLTLSGECQDSVREMAETLMQGGCVDGDLALCEAALSTQCFYHLVELGVPFPCNRYGEYIGYKTDHDPRERATSAGPYTSKIMTEALESSVLQKGIPVFSQMQIIRLLTDQQRIHGILCLDLSGNTGNTAPRFAIFQCQNLIYATGGPAGIYYDSVYPHGHHGSTGLAFEAGATGKNLTEWQYGLASLHPRWNVSGTYMQVLPRFISTTPDGQDEREFLSDFFENDAEMLNRIFLKGYQWPFDIRKVSDGSSIIDILVYLETQKGRKVYLDYRKNPCNGIHFEALSAEARNYLEKAHACFGAPYERLMQMNEPAVDFYRNRGVDLAAEPLEIALCAQHNNGGLSIDSWWQTNIQGLFCIGEASASHGIYRPGGTALNAGQVGALRAAQFISNTCIPRSSTPDLPESLHSQIKEILDMSDRILDGGCENISSLTETVQKKMSSVGAAFRNTASMENLLDFVTDSLKALPEICHGKTLADLKSFFLLRDILLCQQTYLNAMIDYAKKGNHSRGGALYQEAAGTKPYSSLPDMFTFTVDEPDETTQIQEVLCQNHQAVISWRNPRPMPADDNFFENIWKQYRINKNIY